jgi:ABC-type cobalamin/Fe3+-siderophores transport system ATPase subunit
MFEKEIDGGNTGRLGKESPSSVIVENSKFEFHKHEGGQQDSTSFKLSIQDLNIQKGSLTCLIGRIGSGKSTLLSALLNELDTTKSTLPIAPLLMTNQSHTDENSGSHSFRIKSNVGSDRAKTRSNVSNFSHLSHVSIEPLQSPKIMIQGNVAYVSQNNWLQNKTIRVNI